MDFSFVFFRVSFLVPVGSDLQIQRTLAVKKTLFLDLFISFSSFLRSQIFTYDLPTVLKLTNPCYKKSLTKHEEFNF